MVTVFTPGLSFPLPQFATGLPLIAGLSSTVVGLQSLSSLVLVFIMSETLIRSGPVTVLTDLTVVNGKVTTLHALVDEQKNKLIGVAYLSEESARFFNHLESLKWHSLKWIDSEEVPKDITALSLTPEVLNDYLVKKELVVP